jgi:ankyrin repeat protein
VGAVQAARRLVSDGFGDMWTDLYGAALNGDVAEVRRLVAAGADVDEAGPAGWTPLYVAAMNGRVEVIRVLVEGGANTEVKNAPGWTALHAAAFTGELEAVKALAECGANIGARNDAGRTPLEVSTQQGHHQVAQVLRQLERTARTQKAAATSERAQQDTVEAGEAAERIAAELIEEKEREQAAKALTKVCVAPPSSSIELLSVQSGGE